MQLAAREREGKGERAAPQGGNKLTLSKAHSTHTHKQALRSCKSK